MTDDPRRFTLSLIPEDGDVQSDAWQSECERLNHVIAAALSDTDVSVRPAAAGVQPHEGERSRGTLATFSSLVISGLHSGTITAAVGQLWDTLTEWMKRRAGCHCVIKLPDGSEFVFEGLTKEELLTLLSSRESQQRAAPQAGRT